MCVCVCVCSHLCVLVTASPPPLTLWCPVRRDLVFRPQTRDTLELSGHQTQGVDMFVTSERVVLLDAQVSIPLRCLATDPSPRFWLVSLLRVPLPRDGFTAAPCCPLDVHFFCDEEHALRATSRVGVRAQWCLRARMSHAPIHERVLHVMCFATVTLLRVRARMSLRSRC